MLPHRAQVIILEVIPTSLLRTVSDHGGRPGARLADRSEQTTRGLPIRRGTYPLSRSWPDLQPEDRTEEAVRIGE